MVPAQLPDKAVSAAISRRRPVDGYQPRDLGQATKPKPSRPAAPDQKLCVTTEDSIETRHDRSDVTNVSFLRVFGYQPFADQNDRLPL
jgi:hypothetical protein